MFHATCTLMWQNPTRNLPSHKTKRFNDNSHNEEGHDSSCAYYKNAILGMKQKQAESRPRKQWRERDSHVHEIRHINVHVTYPRTTHYYALHVHN